jgi:hypothetical protein
VLRGAMRFGHLVVIISPLTASAVLMSKVSTSFIFGLIRCPLPQACTAKINSGAQVDSTGYDNVRLHFPATFLLLSLPTAHAFWLWLTSTDCFATPTALMIRSCGGSASSQDARQLAGWSLSGLGRFHEVCIVGRPTQPRSRLGQRGRSSQFATLVISAACLDSCLPRSGANLAFLCVGAWSACGQADKAFTAVVNDLPDHHAWYLREQLRYLAAVGGAYGLALIQRFPSIPKSRNRCRGCIPPPLHHVSLLGVILSACASSALPFSRRCFAHPGVAYCPCVGRQKSRSTGLQLPLRACPQSSRSRAPTSCPSARGWSVFGALLARHWWMQQFGLEKPLS